MVRSNKVTSEQVEYIPGDKIPTPLPTNILTFKKIPAGFYRDQPNLYLQVGASGKSSWIFRYKIDGKTRDAGLGSSSLLSLAQPRRKADGWRELTKQSIDPLQQREKEKQSRIKQERDEADRLAAEQAQAEADAANRRTFKQCAVEYHLKFKHEWKNDKHSDQWINTLTTYAYPVFGDMDVSDVGQTEILAVLNPIWISKTETASRILQRIRKVLNWSAAKNYRKDGDPILWDKIAEILPSAKKTKKVKNFAACPLSKVFDSIAKVRTTDASQSVMNCFEYTILTACRSGESRGATWLEIDFEARCWTIPAERMKAGKAHRVPLSDRAIEILDQQAADTDEIGLIFPSTRNKPLSDMTLTALLRRHGFAFTMHGYRSTFRDWCAELTNAPNIVAEQALAHTIPDAVEAAYRRGDLFDKRIALMADWATYCGTDLKDKKDCS